MKEQVRLDTGLTTSNLQAGLLVFEGQDVKYVRQNHVFTMHQKEDKLLLKLKKLETFLWFSRNLILQEFQQHLQTMTSEVTKEELIHLVMVSLKFR